MILDPGSSPLTRNIEDYPEGIIIPIDKPYRWTSADVIRKVKFAAIRHFGKKNLKVGHAGTLDPLATGVLLVCIGKATKLAEKLQSHDKEYVAGITFGATTPSYDLEKDIDRFFPHGHITAEAVSEALPGFIGEQDQIAPLFSAKSVDGVRAYELARKLHKEGKTLDEAAAELIRVSRITISKLELMEFIEASGCCGEGNRATPLAAGGGARAYGVGGVVSTFPSAAVRSEIGNDSVFDHKVCIIDTFHMIHLRTLEPSHVSRQYSCQRTDIMDNRLHCHLRNSTDFSISGCM